ncbi:NADH-quinone oxidoreductase subunit C [Streptomyces sp. NPDC047023]|uniref:NADH-quinone oxidoreductase subunit C n=1 Tax=Streptomyces sp. NPDC047023 TaxID=3155139 RepID=UPI0033FED834
MNLYDSLPDAAATVFGAEALAELSYDVLTVDVPVGSWIPSLEIARDKLGCTYFDWLSAVDEPGTGFRICAHVASLENHRVRRLLLRTTVPHSAPSLPSAVAVYAGAEWHERETFEMFGIRFTDHPNLVHLLLPENFEGHPLRKDFVLAARVAKAWPGAKEPGETHDPDAPKRRQMLPPGVPDPNDWGPMKGQLPPAPARPARTPRAAGAAARTPREGAPVRRTRSVAEGSATQTAESAGTAATPETPARPPRRTRSVSEGSASQAAAADPGAETSEAPARPVRRTRSVSEGSASQAAAAESAAPGAEAPEAPARPPRRTRSVSEGSASQAAAADPGAESSEAPVRPPRRTRSVSDGSASQGAAESAEPAAPDADPAARAPRRPAPRSSDAPWHDPKPAYDETASRPAPEAGPGEPSATDTTDTTDTTQRKTETETDPTTDNGGDA